MLQRMGLAALFLFGLLAVQPARAQEQTGRPFVVVVGIDKYQDAQIKPRQFAEADAKALHELFIAKNRLGAASDHVKLLLGSGTKDQKATKKNIEDALRWLEKSAKKDDLVIFAFFGQGAPVGERSCYFAVDSTFKDRAKDAIASLDIEHIVEKIPSQRFLALVDVHFLGFDTGKEKAPEPNLANFYREFLSQGDDTKEQQISRTLFMAGAGLKPSLNLEKHGIFAKILLDALKGDADSDGGADGNITVSEVAKYLKKTLPDLARTTGKSKDEKEQKPVVLEGQTTDFVVAFNPKVHAESVARLAKFETIAKDQKLDKEITDEGHRLLLAMPKLEARRELRKAYQQLADGKLDVAAFNTERARILDTAKITDREAGNFGLVVMKAVELVRKNYVKETTKGVMVNNAIRGLFLAVNEEVPSEITGQLDKVKEMNEAQLLRLLTDARLKLGKREDLAKGQDITFTLNAMLSKLDRHTGYIPPEVVASFQQDTDGSFKGIGVQIRRSEARDQLQVVTPIYNSPAYRAGLQTNDIITTIISEVNPKTGIPYDQPEIIPTKGMTTNDAVKKILGKPGTRVKLLVEREGEPKPIEFTIIRGTIEVESVLGHKRKAKDDTWDYVIDPENKICYVRLTGFARNTYRDLEKVMKDLSKQGIKGFILDLRFNPGGLLDSSIKISDLFIDDGMIVTIRNRDGTETSYVGRTGGDYTTFPMVCLINGGSASASEIVSACLQDHGRAIIVGSRSFGKGSVQTINFFENDSILKLTTATFWRPSGRNLNKASTKGRAEDEWGVTPNKGYLIDISSKERNELIDHQRNSEIIRKTPGSDVKTDFRDRQLESALEYLRKEIRTASTKTNRDVDNR